MGPWHSCFFVFASLQALVVTAQTTQALARLQMYCMVPDSEPESGIIYVKLELCRWEARCYISPPSTLDATIRSGEGLCLEAEETAVAFTNCTEGASHQQWAFIRASSSGTKLANDDSPDRGQLMLLDASKNSNSCLTTPWDAVVGYKIGERLSIMPCDSSIEEFQTWTYQAPPPEERSLLVMPGRFNAQEPACVEYTVSGRLALSECDEGLAVSWWTKGTDSEIYLAIGEFCLTYKEGYMYVGNCNDSWDELQRWILNESSGALTLAMRPGDGCITYNASWHESFRMTPCSGSSDQILAWRNSTASVTHDEEMV